MMNNRFAIPILLLLMLAGTTQAGLLKNSVDLADLSKVSPEALESLKEPEFAVFVTNVRLRAAMEAEDVAAGGAKAARRIIEAEDLDLKAAKAESKAAKANRDQERMTAAGARKVGAEEDLKTANALIKWKREEQKLREAEVKAAKSAVDLAEAQREMARLRLLSEANAAVAAKYDSPDFEENARKRLIEYDKTVAKVQEKATSVEKLKAAWYALARHENLSETE